MSRRVLLIILLNIALGVTVFLSVRWIARRGTESHSAGSRSAGGGPPGAPGDPGKVGGGAGVASGTGETSGGAAPGGRVESVVELTAGLRAAIERGDTKALRLAAKELRARLLAGGPEAVEALAALLLDDSVDVRLRQAIAIVLGSLPGEKAIAFVAAALERCAGPPELVRSLLLALGMIRDGPGAGIFDAEDQADAETDGSGLAPYVREPLEVEAARRAALERMEDADAETRRIAALVLRASLRTEEVRDAFVRRLGEEQDDEASGEIAAAIGAAVRDMDLDDPGRAEALEAVLAVLPRPGRDVTRFRLEVSLGDAYLDRAEETAVARLVDHDDRNVRLFALEVIGRRLVRSRALEVESARELEAAAATALLTSSDPKVRETAARSLAYTADTKVASTALTRALESDPSPAVRAAAARAFGTARASELPLSEAAIAALSAAATGDIDPAVRAAAAEALGPG